MKAFTTISLLLTAIVGVSALPSDNTPVVETTVEGDFTYIGQATVSSNPPLLPPSARLLQVL